jgi:hypothetical protein
LIVPIVAKSLGFVGITTSVSGQFAALFTAGCFAISAACVATYHLFRGVGAWLRKAFGGGDGSAVKAAKEDNFDVESIDSSASEEVKVSHSDAVHNPTFDPAAARPIATQHKFEALGSKGQSLGFVSVAAQVAIITGADLSGAADGFESADEKDASTAATADAGIPHQLTRNEEKGENEEEDKVGSARPGSSLSGWSE